MGKRSRLGALVGAGVLMFAAVGAVSADAPTYTFTVTKTADPETVPVEGGDVTFTISVHNTGTGLFHTITPTDDMVGCTPAGPVADAGSDGILSAGETWAYTCTVSDVLPDTTNTATVNGCHNASDCNQSAHDYQAEGEVTVGLCESDCDPVDPGDPGPGNSPVGQPQDDTEFGTPGTQGPSDTIWLFVMGLGVVLGSLVVLRPVRVGRHR